ncbi:MAG TPA: hypothetical protein VFW75_16870 [Acetobacteraceae bacterium]|nr:hypothetical protein [Acetobacteraceae bacterium]
MSLIVDRPRGYRRHPSADTVISDDDVEHPRRGGNFLSDEAASAIRQKLITGMGLRPVALEFGVAMNTVQRYRKLLVAEGVELRCQCGGPAGHRGWCAARLSRSEARQEFLKHWPRFKAPALVRPTSLGRRIVLRYPYLGSGTVRSDDLLEKINGIVPRGMPEHIRADVCQEMIADILVGDLAVADAEKFLRRYISRAWGDGFKTISLDAPIRDTDLRMMDTISADRFHF